jgi:eukaryotic-like serine/threonine-protein kinase
MPVLSTVDHLLELVRKSGLVEAGALESYLRELAATGSLPASPPHVAAKLVRDGYLTKFQTQQILQGRHRGFLINYKYKILEVIGSGGMGKVFLCEHTLLRRLAAVKVLPLDDNVHDGSATERFYREARAIASLNDSNIVRAYDIDRDDKLHFLVMEYVDGHSLDTIVRAHGPMAVTRACHYVSQAASGLQHAHEAGWVHRDVKPGNLLLDRQGTVKLLDLGLARLFSDEADSLTKKYDRNNVLGTADYLSPEQAMNSHDVDIRSDIYSLGATFYFLLAGKPPFPGGGTAQKLIWHQLQQPTPLREWRPDLPEELTAVVGRMMAKDPADRFQQPAEVMAALAPWTAVPIAPPPEQELPKHCPAVRRIMQAAGMLNGMPGPRRAGLSSLGIRPSQADSSGPAPSSGSLRPAAEMDTKVSVSPSQRTPRPATGPLPVVAGRLAEPVAAQLPVWKRRAVAYGAIAAALCLGGALGSWMSLRPPVAGQSGPNTVQPDPSQAGKGQPASAKPD